MAWIYDTINHCKRWVNSTTIKAWHKWAVGHPHWHAPIVQIPAIVDVCRSGVKPALTAGIIALNPFLPTNHPVYDHPLVSDFMPAFKQDFNKNLPVANSGISTLGDNSDQLDNLSGNRSGVNNFNYGSNTNPTFDYRNSFTTDAPTPTGNLTIPLTKETNVNQYPNDKTSPVVNDTQTADTTTLPEIESNAPNPPDIPEPPSWTLILMSLGILIAYEFVI